MPDVRRTAREAAPWIESTARLGYAAQGTVYALIGGLTAWSAYRGRGHAADKRAALSFIADAPFGKLLLVLIFVGLCGYAVWRFLSGFADTEDRGSDPKGLAIRAGSVARGIIYGAVALGVLRLLRGNGGGSGSDHQTRHWTAKALDMPAGRWLVVLAGLAVIGAAVYQLYRAAKGKFSKRLQSARLSDGVRSLCRFGIAARGVVFAIIGSSLVFAGLHGDSSEAEGTAGALRAIATKPFGHLLLIVVGLGLVAYGLYAFVNARYRIIDAA